MDRERLKSAWARARAKMNNWRARSPRIPAWAALTGGVVALIALAVIFWDWNVFKGPLEQRASAAIGRKVTIGGDLDVDLGWTTRVTVPRVSVANPEWAKGDMARIGRVRVDVQIVTFLVSGALILPRVEVDHPNVDLVRLRDGRANWRIGEEGDGREVALPFIGRMLITNGRVHVTDERHAMVFDGTVESREGPAGEAARAFVLKGQGTLGNKPFVATMTGDSPVRADRRHPYVFDARIAMGRSTMTARGNLPRPFDIDHVAGVIEIAGPDMADLYHVTGLAFPNTPPYRLRANLTRTVDVWRFNGLHGLIGSTDVAGTMGVDDTTDRPLLTADLSSRKADIDDIATLFGDKPEVRTIPAGTGSQAAAAQTQEARRSFVAETIGFLPDAPLDVQRVRRMDARVKYRAATIATGGVPMRDLAVTVKLDHGVLTADPATVRLAFGKLSGSARMDARRAIPEVDLNVRLTDARVEQFFAAGRTGADRPVTGEIEARVKLHGRGLSVRRAVSTAQGDIVLSVPRGEIRQSVAELLGVNVVNGLGLMLTDDDSRTELRCAIAEFRADNGTLRVRRFVLDTGIVLAVGTGSADLTNETLDLRVEGHPKKFRIGRLMAPITIRGRMSDPKVGIEAGKAVAQLGIAGALGTLLTPVAAIVPLISTGSTKDVDCARLLAGGTVEIPSN
jgi:AsmA family protein